MLASMYSAVSGLQAHQTKMNVIGNNIANVNTYGFKKSRASFTDVFYQTLSGSSAASTTTGGKNPSQLGYGATVNTVDIIHKTAGSSTTDRALDVYINGDGYLAVKDSNGTINYTRVGILSFDASGNLVDSNGNFVLGFNPDPTTGKPKLGSDGTTTVQNLINIKSSVDELDKYSSISIGPTGEITAIKEGNQAFTIGQTSWLDSSEPMSEGSTLTGSVNIKSIKNVATGFVADTAATNAGFTVTPVLDTLNISGDVSFSFKADAIANPGTKENYTLSYTDLDGVRKSVDAASATNADPSVVTFNIPNREDPTTNTTFTVSATAAGITAVGAPGTVKVGTSSIAAMDIEAATFNKAGESLTNTQKWTSSAETTSPMTFSFTNSAGATENLTLNVKNATLETEAEKDVDGLVSAIGSIAPGDGIPVKLGQLALATFTNEGGLSQNGQGYFLPSNNSGTAVIKVPGTGGTGGLRSGALEMSNVDLSYEFTEMIICQRGFQANTKMITVSDEMLSELVSMKR